MQRSLLVAVMTVTFMETMLMGQGEKLPTKRLPKLPTEIVKIIVAMAGLHEEPCIEACKTYESTIKRVACAYGKEFTAHSKNNIPLHSYSPAIKLNMKNSGGRTEYITEYSTPGFVLTMSIEELQFQFRNYKVKLEQTVDNSVVKDISFTHNSRVEVKPYGFSADGKYLIANDDTPWACNMLLIDVSRFDMEEALKVRKGSFEGLVLQNIFLKKLAEHMAKKTSSLQSFDALPLAVDDDRKAFCLLPDAVKNFLLEKHVVKKAKKAAVPQQS